MADDLAIDYDCSLDDGNSTDGETERLKDWQNLLDTLWGCISAPLHYTIRSIEKSEIMNKTALNQAWGVAALTSIIRP